ncbi:MAG: hypothetical protein IJ250_04435 [Bacteroidales bacterium]|nr:hypothetical protein [Bacteroidales bacterium]
MKRWFYSAALAATAMLILSCGKGDVYKSEVSFDNYRWERLTDKKTISFDNIHITDTDAVYDVYVDIRHTPYINEKQVKFLMKIISPDGVTRESSHTIKLTDRYGEKWAGDAAGDLIDIQTKCKSFVSFPKQGDYTITLTNLGMYASMTGIISIGVKVEKADLKAYKSREKQ